MNSDQALQSFWSSFGWKAYDENTVPEDAELPRITYEVAKAEFEQTVPCSASLWIKSLSWEAISLKATEIYESIGLGGKLLKIDGGYIWVRRSSPYSQRMGDSDDTIRRIVINTELEYFIPN